MMMDADKEKIISSYHALPATEQSAIADLASAVHADVEDWITQDIGHKGPRVQIKKGHVHGLNATPQYCVFDPDSPIGWKENGQPDYNDQYHMYSNDALEHLPGSIGDLPRLETLILDWNEMHDVPEEMARLNNLATLDLAHGNFTTIPEPITRLQNLRTLILKYLPITTIPESIGKMTSLEKLWLGYYPSLVDSGKVANTLVFPETAGNMQNLRVLRLDMMPSVVIPGALARVEKLENIALYRTRIENLDEFLLSLPAWSMKIDLRYEKDLFGPDIFLLGTRTSFSINDDNFIVRFPLPEGKLYNISIKGYVYLEGRDSANPDRKPATILAPNYDDIDLESPMHQEVVIPVPWKDGGKISNVTFDGNELVIQGS